MEALYSEWLTPVPADICWISPGRITIHQDVRLWRATIAADGAVELPMSCDRHAWVQIVRGIVETDDGELREGDGLGLDAVENIRLTSPIGAEVLIFDLA